MTVLIFDTETSGLVDRRFEAEDPAQPDVVQVAALLCGDGGEVLSTHIIARPHENLEYVLPIRYTEEVEQFRSY